ncbi:hypothetical protein BT96DRAFT_1006751 [Gymnopus androsaceus JB14]|uniref:Uncharacterized protein n=1 Tax=Gymnopus androsaceus JB14 TaxID=1447944 RepID=A0A6A4GJP3_9AGAR|nr:hypothetical protein BT96DRAFT_1006751 [Gymnopus androsaceus JB14]
MNTHPEYFSTFCGDVGINDVDASPNATNLSKAFTLARETVNLDPSDVRKKVPRLLSFRSTNFFSSTFFDLHSIPLESFQTLADSVFSIGRNIFSLMKASLIWAMIKIRYTVTFTEHELETVSSIPLCLAKNCIDELVSMLFNGWQTLNRCPSGSRIYGSIE